MRLRNGRMPPADITAKTSKPTSLETGVAHTHTTGYTGMLYLALVKILKLCSGKLCWRQLLRAFEMT